MNVCMYECTRVTPHCFLFLISVAVHTAHFFLFCRDDKRDTSKFRN